VSRVAYLAVVIILAVPAPAPAAQPSPEVRQLCEADYHRL
jgi:hypothetical protein